MNGAEVLIPSGKNEGLPLSELVSNPLGEQWLAWALRQDWALDFRFTLEQWARENAAMVYLVYQVEAEAEALVEGTWC